MTKTFQKKCAIEETTEEINKSNSSEDIQLSNKTKKDEENRSLDIPLPDIIFGDKSNNLTDIKDDYNFNVDKILENNPKRRKLNTEETQKTSSTKNNEMDYFYSTLGFGLG